MAIELTFSMIKPDATARRLSGAINAMIEAAGFEIAAQKLVRITRAQAERFYDMHRERPFYGDLCDFISSGPVVVQVLRKENAVADYRKLMGATNPEQAEKGTIRKLYAVSIDQNSVHGSDARETAEREIKFFFSEVELVG